MLPNERSVNGTDQAGTTGLTMVGEYLFLLKRLCKS